MVSVFICMLIIHRYMVVAVRQPYRTYSSVCRHALTRFTAGCSPTDLSWIPTSRSCSGVPLLADSINSQDVRSGSGLKPSFRRRLFEILEFISTLISAWRRMSNGLSQVALQSCVSYAAFDELFRRLSISRWLLPLCYRGWIMVTRHWLASRLACLTVSSPSSTRQLDRSIAGLRRSEHITDALASFRWLRAPELIKFKLAVIVYRALHGTAPQYLSDQLQYVADLPTRHRGRLRSSTSSLLEVRSSRCVTVGDRSFAIAGPRLWNSLPDDIQSAPSLATFRQ